MWDHSDQFLCLKICVKKDSEDMSAFRESMKNREKYITSLKSLQLQFCKEVSSQKGKAGERAGDQIKERPGLCGWWRCDFV